MKNLKKLILPILLFLAALFEMSFGLWNEFVEQANLPSYYVVAFRMLSLALSLAVTFMQQPPQKRARGSKNMTHQDQ